MVKDESQRYYWYSDGKVVMDVDSMSELLIDYFGTVFTKENRVSELPEVENVYYQDDSHRLDNIDITQKS